ncbi:MAG: DUF7520 family protein [Halobacteriota archaeon]
MSTTVRGSRFVFLLYLGLVCFAGLAGAMVGIFVEGAESPAFLFLIPFPATPAGIAAYGALTVATVLGIPLLLVVAASRAEQE